MPTPRVFATGVTGYVGGDALSVLLATHRDWQYTFLVRSESRVAGLRTQYPSSSIRIVIGDLSDTELLASEAATADIVLHFASSDDVPAIEAIVRGLGSSASTSHNKFLVHTSGAANLGYEDLTTGNIGKPNSKVWDDIADIDAINAWPDEVIHRPVERVVLEAHKNYPHLKTAIVCPPGILGAGRGPGNTRTIQVPLLIELIRQRGRAFQVGAGKSAWGFVHIHDLTDVYLRITDAAAAGGANADWGREGWYFTENGLRDLGSISEVAAKRLVEKGVLESMQVDSLDKEEATKLHPFMLVLAGVNAKCKATRTRKVLGWKPQYDDFEKLVEETVDDELIRKESRLADAANGHFPAPGRAA